MKTAWVTVQEWDGRTVGQIERITTESEWPIFCVNSGWVIPVEFDEQTLNERFLLARQTEINSVFRWEVYQNPDMAASLAAELKEKQIAWEEECIKGGNKILSYFNYMIGAYGYGETEKMFFLTDADFNMVGTLLAYGDLNNCIALLTSKTVVDAYTAPFKAEFIAKAQEISDAIGNRPVA